MAAPFGSINEAMVVATAGTIVALGTGTFDEEVVIAEGVTLWGACVAMTHLASSIPSWEAGTLTVLSPGVEIRNLHVSGDRPGIWVSSAGAAVNVEDVVVGGAYREAWKVREGAQATGRSVVLRDTRSADGFYARGLLVQTGSEVNISRAVIERNRGQAVFVYGVGTTLSLADVTVRDTTSHGNSAWTDGVAIELDGGATVNISRAIVERNRDVALFAYGAGTTLTLSDVVVRDTLSQEPEGRGGWGLLARWGAQVNANRVVLERNRQEGLLVVEPDTSATLADVVVRDTQSAEGTAVGGTGLNAQTGAHLDVSRAVLSRNRHAGAFAWGMGTRVNLVDIVVHDTQSRESDGNFGEGLVVRAGAHLDLTRAILEGNRGAGVEVANEGTMVHLADLVVRDTRSVESDGTFGRGLSARYGAHVDVNRAVLERNRDVGVYAGTAAVVHLDDVVVSDMREQECWSAGTCFKSTTSGLGSFFGASIIATRFVVSGSAQCGVQLAKDGTMDLQDGEVIGNPLGANVQTVDFDLARLQLRVSFRDNGVDIDNSPLSLPR